MLPFFSSSLLWFMRKVVPSLTLGLAHGAQRQTGASARSMPPVTCGIKHLQFGYILCRSIHLQEAKASVQTVAPRRTRASLSLLALAKMRCGEVVLICSEVVSAEVLVFAPRVRFPVGAALRPRGSRVACSPMALDGRRRAQLVLVFSENYWNQLRKDRGGGVGERRRGRIFCEKQSLGFVHVSTKGRRDDTKGHICHSRRHFCPRRSG